MSISLETQDRYSFNRSLEIDAPLFEVLYHDLGHHQELLPILIINKIIYLYL